MIGRTLLEVSCVVDFVVDFIAGIIELIAELWIDRMNRKWKSRKKK